MGAEAMGVQAMGLQATGLQAMGLQAARLDVIGIELGITSGGKPGFTVGSKLDLALAAERRISAKRRDIARLRHDMRLQEAEMQMLIANDIDCSGAANLLLRMRKNLAGLIAERDAMIAALIGMAKAG
jgi:hypothetical protein